ncbi:MAG TPA: ABC transporter ATP-binding protein, partial [Clostridia bacterium]|nr:ABC transporter ATP-binding protein [Clostridia bacterium]
MRVVQRVLGLIAKVNTQFMYYYNYVHTEGAGKDIRLYGQQNLIQSLLSQDKYEWVKAMSRMESETAGVTAAANSLVSGLTYLLIGLRALDGLYSIGQVQKFVGAVIVLSRSMTRLISTGAMLWENIPYLRKLYQYLDLTDPKYRGTLTTEKRADNDYELEFHDVSFRYPGSEQYALKNINLKLNVGRRLAVVGMNGSGKTTLIKLLCRLYDPTEGVITLNGVDIRKYDYEEYLGIFSVVFQDFTLTDLPLGQNVAARVEYDPERVRQSLEAAGLSERLAALSQGLDTALNKGFEEDGVMISGGEAQKIALARALYKGAPFVLLDEPTA